MYQYRQALTRMRLGDTDRAVARAGLLGRARAAAVRRIAAEQGWLDPAAPLPTDAEIARHLKRPAARSSSVSLVEPFAAEVEAWSKEGIQGTTIYQALVRKHGFTGSYSSVRRFLSGLEHRQPQATVVLDFAPGEVAQVDFGKGPMIAPTPGAEPVSTWVFVMTLAWSRHQYAELVTDQSVATWLGCHRRAFEWFNGVPATIVIDNPKCAITRACYHDPEVQRAYFEAAEAYGFKIAPCPPRDPCKKGRVEAGVKYVKGSFFPLREFRDLTNANRQLHAWVLGEAGNRLHGTTRERPLTRFAETERYLLRELPARAPQLGAWASVTVAKDHHVTHERCRYSVPYTLVGKGLWLRATDTTVQVFQDHTLVATHPRLTKAGERHTVDDHLPPEALAFKRQDPTWCRGKASDIGPSCSALIDALFAHRVLDNLRAAQGVIRLTRSFGAARVEAACARALAFDDPRYRTVKTILQNGFDQQPAEADLAPAALPAAYTGAGRYCRDTSTLLNT